jgi:hypothetical protein
MHLNFRLTEPLTPDSLLLSGINTVLPPGNIFQGFFQRGTRKANIPQITHLNVQVETLGFTDA